MRYSALRSVTVRYRALPSVITESLKDGCQSLVKRMSGLTKTAVGHVTSTTSGKYLNPEVSDLDEIYSKRTPLDLLIETCNNIGRDDASKQTCAKQRKPRTSLRGQIDQRHQSFSTKQQTTSLSDTDSGNTVVTDWYPILHDNKGTKSNREGEAFRRIKSAAGATIDQDRPEDLRLWCNRHSPGGSSMLNSPDGSSGRSISRDSLSSLSPSSESPTAPDGKSYPTLSYDPDEVKRHVGQSPLTARAIDGLPLTPPQGFDMGLLLHQYLELQSLAQLAVLQERANHVRRLTLEKPLTALTNPLLAAAEMSQEPRAIFGLSDILAGQPLLSKIPKEEIFRSLSPGMALGSLLPLGVPYLGEISPFHGPLPLPSIYHQHLASKAGLLADSFLPGGFQLRPEEAVFGNSPLLLAKHLQLLHHLSGSSDSAHPYPMPPFDASPLTRGATPDLYVEARGPMSPDKSRIIQSPSRKHSSRSPVVKSAQRHHPYGRSESPSTRSPVSLKQSPSYNRHSAFREPVLLSEAL